MSHRAQQGVLLMVAAMVCFTMLDTVSKFIGATVPVALAMGVRFGLQASATAGVLLPRRGRAMFGTRHLGLQIIRGVLMFVSGALAYTSLRFMPVADFTAILAITPLMITAGAARGEGVSLLRWLLVAGGFAGALIVIRPGAASFDWVLLLPLGVVASSTAFQLLTGRLARTEDAGTTHFFTGVVGAVLCAALLPFTWKTPESASIWMLLMLLGVLGTLGHYLLILGYGRAGPATLAPFLYTQIPFAVLSGWLVFAHAPDAWAVLGIVLIGGCGIIGTRLAARDQADAVARAAASEDH